MILKLFNKIWFGISFATAKLLGRPLPSQHKVICKEPCNKPFATTTIQIMIDERVIGAIQELSIIERNNAQYATRSINLLARGVRFDRQKITEIFTRELISPAVQKLPFQIIIHDNKNEAEVIVQNVWIDDIMTHQYQTNAYTIVDEMKLLTEKVVFRRLEIK